MSFGRLAFDKASKELSDLLVEGAILGKDAWEIASALDLIVRNALILSETRLSKQFSDQGTYDYLDEVSVYLKKYFKDFDYKN